MNKKPKIKMYRVKEEFADIYIHPEDRLQGYITEDEVSLVLKNGTKLPGEMFEPIPGKVAQFFKNLLFRALMFFFRSLSKIVK